MTRLEVMKDNKRHYAELEKRIPYLTGLELSVAVNVTRKWLSAHNWLGGLSDSDATVAYMKVTRAHGCSMKEVDAEFHRQMGWFI